MADFLIWLLWTIGLATVVVTLVDNVPAGLTLTAATGTGWTCGIVGATANCTRSDPLALAKVRAM